MIRDPFYRQIEGALDELTDRDAFEACVCDLLRTQYPTLRPVRGGSDAGADGLIADGEEEAFHLVATTARDVQSNFSGSLDSCLKDGSRNRKVVLATSQSLTPQAQRKLRDEAREKGFTLVDLVWKEAVVGLLYTNPRWAKDLLGLSGSPPALGIIPQSRRPLLALEPVGRDKDLAWLRETKGDRILSGEPGSGKTFLLYRLALQGWGLFVNRQDLTEISNALRELQGQNREAPILIVDDAHVDPEFLVKLKHLREDETEFSFFILAVTWKGAQGTIAEALGSLAEDRMWRLQPLARKQVEQVYRQLGIDELALRSRGVQKPDQVLRDLFDQASNRPGLAVTLGQLWLQGEYAGVHRGELLSRTYLDALRRIIGDGADERLLACFALGGEKGMPAEVVREYLGVDRLKLHRDLSDLAAGGALSEEGADCLAVQPEAFRSALIRTVFLEGPASLDYRELLTHATSRAEASRALLYREATMALLYSVQRGAKVPAGLQDLVAEVNTDKAWNAFGLLGRDQIAWVLRQESVDIRQVGWTALEEAPDLAIPRLLEKAAGPESDPFDFRWGAPLEIIRGWLQEMSVQPGESAARRRVLACQAVRFWGQGGSREVVVHAMCLAFSPILEESVSDPGMGSTVKIRVSLLSLEEVSELTALWRHQRSWREAIEASDWPRVGELLRSWTDPEWASRGAKPSAQLKDAMYALAVEMVHDLERVASRAPALATSLSALAAEAGIAVSLQPDSDFELVFPSKYSEEERRVGSERFHRLDDLARELASRPSSDVAFLLTSHEEEARSASLGTYFPFLEQLSTALARRCQAPENWLAGFLEARASTTLVNPLLQRVVNEQRAGWQEVLTSCLTDDAYRGYAVALALQLPDLSDELLGLVLGNASSAFSWVERLSLKKQIPQSTLKRLLEHENWQVACAAAMGLWEAEPRQNIPAKLQPEWKDAVRGSLTDDYNEVEGFVGLRIVLCEIFSTDRQLAVEWLRQRVESGNMPRSLGEGSPFLVACNLLTRDEKRDLFQRLPSFGYLNRFLLEAVASDVWLFRELLAIERLRPRHLTPLRRCPDAAWSELASIALETGWSSEEIAGEAFVGCHLTGYGIDYWGRWLKAFRALRQDPRPGIQEVAAIGERLATKKVTAGVAKRREHELYGM